MTKIVSSILGLLMLIYPLAVYFGIQYFEPWIIASSLFVLLLIRLVITTSDKNWNRLLLIICLMYCVFAVWNNNVLSLRFYPVLISFGLFAIFASSLFYPPPIVERLARLQHPELPEQGVIYTRRVTQVWCAFFMINGCIAFITAVACSFAFWSLYNGLISYLLMGLLMAIEYLVRIKTQAHVR